jgi:hypothetical protein
MVLGPRQYLIGFEVVEEYLVVLSTDESEV